MKKYTALQDKQLVKYLQKNIKKKNCVQRALF